jgi:AcrR family transcriptional regulator
MNESSEEHPAGETAEGESIRQPKGRPLDRSRDVAILAAALEVLGESGYDRLTMDIVAARARAGKAALYRRWCSKAELVVDALALHHAPLPLPDTGTLLGDLEVLLEHGQLTREDCFGTCIVAGLATACSRDPELARALNDRFLETGHRVLRVILERAVDRGEVPRERDLEFVIEIIPALLLSRVLTSGKPPDKAFAHRIVHEVIYPLATSPVSGGENRACMPGALPGYLGSDIGQ